MSDPVNDAAGTMNANSRALFMGELKDGLLFMIHAANNYPALVAALKEAAKWKHQMNAETHKLIEQALKDAGEVE